MSIRVARQVYGVSADLWKLDGSVLILGRPGCGKTTLMRDMIQQYSLSSRNHITVIDEREELFPRSNGLFCFCPGPKTDIISGCSKEKGIIMALRNMTPAVIAVDEITAHEDCAALLEAGWCGVDLFATAHAKNQDDLRSRPIYQTLMGSGLFKYVVILELDKSWHLEEVKL